MRSRSPVIISSCLIESLRAWIRHPIRTVVRISLKNGDLPHFWWIDRRDGNQFHFDSLARDLPIYRQLLYKGRVRQIRGAGV